MGPSHYSGQPPQPDALIQCPMTTLLITHPSFLAHDTGAWHPERPDRMRAIDKVLGHDMFKGLKRVEAPLRDDVEERLASRIPKSSWRRSKPPPKRSAGTGAAAYRRRHRHVRRHVGGRVARGECRPRGRRQSLCRRSQECLLPGAPAGTPRRERPRHGLLPVLERGHRRASTRARSTAPNASPSSISTSTTATARRTSSGPTRTCSTAPRTRCRSFPARVR